MRPLRAASAACRRAPLPGPPKFDTRAPTLLGTRRLLSLRVSAFCKVFREGTDPYVSPTTRAGGGSPRADPGPWERGGSLVRPWVAVCVCVCARTTEPSMGCRTTPAPRRPAGGTGSFSPGFIRPGRGFPSRNPRGPVRAQRGARVPALRRRSTRRPGCAGCRGPASRSFPSLQVRPQRTSRALQPVCFELRLLLFQRPPPPTSPPSDGGGESFHPYFTAEGNRAWGQGGGEGASRCVPSARHCFPTPSIRT